MTRSKFALRAGAAVAGTLAIAALALPAIAADGDITGTKSNNAGGTVQDGDTFTYTVNLQNPSANPQASVYVEDDMDPGLVYVPGSTDVSVLNYALESVACDTLPEDANPTPTPVDACPRDGLVFDGAGGRSDYNFGQGWATDWTEFLDDGVNNTGYVRAQGGVDQNSLRLSGFTTAPVNAADALANYPAIARQVDPASLTGLQKADLTFQTNDSGLSGDDRLGVWISRNGGAYVLAAEIADSVANAPQTVDLDAFLPATSLTVRFGVSAGDYAGAAGSQYFTVDDVYITGVVATIDLYDNDPTGLNNLYDGDPNTGLIHNAPNDPIMLPAVVNFHSTSYVSAIGITYDAVVEFDDLVGWPTELDNTAYWWGDTYTSLWSQSSSTVDVDYEPAIDAAVSSNGPVQTGQPIIITVVLDHADTSDGSPVCAADVDKISFTGGAVSGNFIGDTDDDDCLDAGETWTFTITYPGVATAGIFAFTGEFTGWSVNEQGEGADDEDVDVNVTADTDVVVVLADTGAANTGLAGVAAALVALGATALVVARRRNA